MPKISPMSLDSALRQAVSQALHDEIEGLRREIAALRSDLAGRSGKLGAQPGATSTARPSAAGKAKAPKAPRARGSERGGQRKAGSLTAKQVKAIRARLGVSQRRFAALSSVTPVAVYFWESGRTTPSLEKEAILLRLAKATPEVLAATAAKPPKTRASSKKKGASRTKR